MTANHAHHQVISMSILCCHLINSLFQTEEIEYVDPLIFRREIKDLEKFFQSIYQVFFSRTQEYPAE